jgi:hypothetical protein
VFHVDSPSNLEARESTIDQDGIGLMSKKLVIVMSPLGPANLGSIHRKGRAQFAGQIQERSYRRELRPRYGQCLIHASPDQKNGNYLKNHIACFSGTGKNDSLDENDRAE